MASVRPTPSSAHGNIGIGTYGLPRYSLTGVSLPLLLSFAYDIDQANFTGLPKGASDANFDLQVECDEGYALTYERLKPLLQGLLAERFGLVARTGTKEASGFSLIVAKGGPKLAAASAGEGSYFNILRDELRAVNVPLESFARVLRNAAGRPVSDGTGLGGKYNITVHFAAVDDPDPKFPSIFTALREQLGLELKPAQVPVPTLNIEHLNLQATED